MCVDYHSLHSTISIQNLLYIVLDNAYHSGRDLSTVFNSSPKRRRKAKKKYNDQAINTTRFSFRFLSSNESLVFHVALDRNIGTEVIASLLKWNYRIHNNSFSIYNIIIQEQGFSKNVSILDVVTFM